MQLTLRLENDNYLDVHIDIESRELTLLSPIPGITLLELMEIADQMHYKINLLITEEQIQPDLSKCTTTEIEEYYTLDTKTALTLLLSLCNNVVSEF